MSKKKDTKTKKVKKVLGDILMGFPPFPEEAETFEGPPSPPVYHPFNPYKPPENKQVGVLVVTGGCYKEFGNQHKKVAFSEFARWKW